MEKSVALAARARKDAARLQLGEAIGASVRGAAAKVAHRWRWLDYDADDLHGAGWLAILEELARGHGPTAPDARARSEWYFRVAERAMQDDVLAWSSHVHVTHWRRRGASDDPIPARDVAVSKAISAAEDIGGATTSTQGLWCNDSFLEFFTNNPWPMVDLLIDVDRNTPKEPAHAKRNARPRRRQSSQGRHPQAR